MSDVTRILVDINGGDSRAAEQLLPLVYDELRKLAAHKMIQERPGQTLDATALVHEAYLRLVGSPKEQRWDNRGHFFSAAAEAMRRILVENARRKGRLKRGGALRRIDLESADLVSRSAPDDLLDLDEALTRLSAEDREAAELVKLRLFNAHRDAGSFLAPDAPAFANTLQYREDEPPLSEKPGSIIGPYKLLEQIGEGGFGVVFMAEQIQPVRRKVALKILKPGMDSRQVVARFEAERQALAIMDHPNIARVFDGGSTPSGRPYFVMELVKGVPITEFCDQNHLTPKQRLELFVPVCQAVQHAHQKGIIHRDLKPSNVMVSVHDTMPVAKVIDFGVAKALGQGLTEKTLFTGFAQMIGTPLYMSPEQAGQSGLDVDTRSDVYSLGVLLYELLTGTTPFTRERFKTAEYDEIRRIIREEEPPKPSTRLSESRDVLPSIAANRNLEPSKLRGLVQGELDWIVMKALEKDRNRRYETAAGFALDIQRYLADEQVEACPPSAGYRFRKFARRNKVVLRTTTAVALTLIAGTVTSILLAIRATDAEKLADTRWKAERAARQAESEARNAETAARNDAIAARDEAIAESYRALLGETRALREARPAGWRATALENLRQLRAMETPRRDLLELRNEAVACFGELDAYEVDRFEGHTHLVYGVDFSPDGKTLATAGYDGRVCLWNPGKRRPARQITDPAAATVGLWGDQAPLPVVRSGPMANASPIQPGPGRRSFSAWGKTVPFRLRSHRLHSRAILSLTARQHGWP
jgi:RNA polymerase sigma factor (TIGR02999 family)